MTNPLIVLGVLLFVLALFAGWAAAPLPVVFLLGMAGGVFATLGVTL